MEKKKINKNPIYLYPYFFGVMYRTHNQSILSENIYKEEKTHFTHTMKMEK